MRQLLYHRRGTRHTHKTESEIAKLIACTAQIRIQLKTRNTFDCDRK